ncbi:hypothetical protein B0I35DRAFT_120282 [Stachybotrys elegans]|uniref:Secreted protein n=1 Tax=Stachybotrys elegans TaxID=80388 RepID=A0A8K0WUN9_9HYPO|nr:hypothetical protein B0I35DRAFT_120282 [Stachybotrys elegans]
MCNCFPSTLCPLPSVHILALLTLAFPFHRSLDTQESQLQRNWWMGRGHLKRARWEISASPAHFCRGRCWMERCSSTSRAKSMHFIQTTPSEILSSAQTLFSPNFRNLIPTQVQATTLHSKHTPPVRHLFLLPFFSFFSPSHFQSLGSSGPELHP